MLFSRRFCLMSEYGTSSAHLAGGMKPQMPLQMITEGMLADYWEVFYFY